MFVLLFQNISQILHNSICLFQTGDEVDLDGKAQDEEQTAEGRVKGNVGWNIFMKYITAGGGIPSLALLVFMAVLTQFVASGSDYWLNYW